MLLVFFPVSQKIEVGGFPYSTMTVHYGLCNCFLLVKIHIL